MVVPGSCCGAVGQDGVCDLAADEEQQERADRHEHQHHLDHTPGFGFQVSVFGFRFSGFGIRFSGFGIQVFGIWVSGFRVDCLSFGVWGLPEHAFLVRVVLECKMK